MTKSNFTSSEIFNRDDLLNEALEIIRFGDVSLGKKQSLEFKKQLAIELLEKFQTEQVRFSPQLDIRTLNSLDFKDQQISLSHELQAKMLVNDFYQVNIPIMLFPKSGWAFTRLECSIEFCPDESEHRPIVHDMFPHDIWADVISLNTQLNISLDHNLSFKPEKETELKMGLSGHFKAGVFSYNVRRAKVLARGRGDVGCFWRLDGKECVNNEDTLLSVILAVPKTRKKPLHAIGSLRAYHDFQLGSADIFKDYTQDFSKVLKSLFSTGIPVDATMVWENIMQ
ncbi:MAG: hypothetical protein WCI11_00260 [Candidatus Methylumidiphilus sp.]